VTEKREVPLEQVPEECRPKVTGVEVRIDDPTESGKPYVRVGDEAMAVIDRREKCYSFIIPVLREQGRAYVGMLREPKYAVANVLLGFPGGAVDPGEDALEAALREAQEEIGISFCGPRHCIARNLVEFPDKVMGGAHTVYIAQAESRVPVGAVEPEAPVLWLPLNSLHDRDEILARDDARRMLTRLLVFEAYRALHECQLPT